MKNYLSHIKIGFFFLFIAFSSNTVSANENILFKHFLYSKNLEEVEKAYRIIVENTDKFDDIVFNELLKFSKNPNDTPDRLLIIAAYIRDRRYIEPLLNIINFAEYSSKSCIYDCPIVLSLVSYGAFSPYDLPSDLNTKNVAVYDLVSAIKIISEMALKNDRAGKYVKGPGVDDYFKKYESLSTKEIIEIAGHKTKDFTQRAVAAYILQYRLVESKFLPDLYWLAISEPEPDGAMEFRNAIYWSIYKAEKVKMKKPIGIGSSLSTTPSHTTGHTGRVSGGSAD